MRLRWYRLTTDLQTKTIATSLNRMAYKEGAIDGFIIEKLHPEFLEAFLVQRVQTEYESIDPFGNTERYEFVEYIKTYFRLSTRDATLELLDPGHSGSKLISRLLEALGQKFYIEELAVNPLAWANAFRAEVGLYGTVEKIQIGSIAIGGSAVGQLLVKGSGDIAEVAIEFVSPSDYCLEKVQVKFGAYRGSVSFQKNGSVFLSSAISEQWRDPFRNSLRSLLTSTGNIPASK